MAVYGIGAYYDGTDVSNDFVQQNCACIGYDKSDASSLYEMLRRIKIGDIIYLKSYTWNNATINIKAIGFVTGRKIEKFKFPNSNNSMGFGREVLWKKVYADSDEWIRVTLPQEDLKYNVYNNTLYEEYSESVIKKLLKQL